MKRKHPPPLDEPTVRQVLGESRRRRKGGGWGVRWEDRKSFSRPQQTIEILKGRDYKSRRKVKTGIKQPDVYQWKFKVHRKRRQMCGVAKKGHLNYIKTSQRRFVLDNGNG